MFACDKKYETEFSHKERAFKGKVILCAVMRFYMFVELPEVIYIGTYGDITLAALDLGCFT